MHVTAEVLTCYVLGLSNTSVKVCWPQQLPTVTAAESKVTKLPCRGRESERVRAHVGLLTFLPGT